jgi:hypothetical protein
VLDRLDLRAFEPLVGQRFVLGSGDDAGDQEPLDLVLLEARVLSHGDGRTRVPFSLIFRSGPGLVRPQRIYRLEHAELGTLELFLVPIGRDAEGVRYEAIFT